MGHQLIDAIEENGPLTFDAVELASVSDLFEERAALFYTPTENIPDHWIGSGPFDVILPIAPPSRFELNELIGHRYPRIWVDLLQRATGKLRWTPRRTRTRVLVEIHDTRDESHHAGVGVKALVDALKAMTTGRPDARPLYYFGVIQDDSPRHIDLDIVQCTAKSPAHAFSRIVVE